MPHLYSFSLRVVVVVKRSVSSGRPADECTAPDSLPGPDLVAGPDDAVLQVRSAPHRGAGQENALFYGCPAAYLAVVPDRRALREPRPITAFGPTKA